MNSLPDPSDERDGDRRTIAALVMENARLCEAVAARDSFIAVAAHELRNPMTPILGRVTLLRRAAGTGATSEQIVTGLERIEHLVVEFIQRATTLLDVARADADVLPVDAAPVDVARLVTELVERYRPLAAHAGAAIVLDLADGLVVRADRLALEQVIENLLTNAIKYGAGSDLFIRVTHAHESGMASIEICDGGPGIPVDAQSRIFERYARAQEPHTQIVGFGVGLWIVRRLCDAMGGRVDLHSTPGNGATFRVTLPVFDETGDA